MDSAFVSLRKDPTLGGIGFTYILKLRGLVRQQTIPTERPPLVGEVSANFSG
jgi:hypothetical protein